MVYVGGDVGGVVGVEAIDAFGDCVDDFWLSKKNARDTNEWCIKLPLNHRGIIRESPRKLTKTKAYFIRYAAVP